MLVKLLDQLRDVVFDLESLGSLQMLRLIRSEQHWILLLRAEIQEELLPCLLQLATLKLDVFVRVHALDCGLALEYGPLALDLLDVDHFELDGLGLLVVVIIVRVAVFTARGAGTSTMELFFFIDFFGGG